MRGRLEHGTLAVAVFVAGAVLLGVEIAASRVVAPFFGNSLYVWGALIGVVLSGLAVGYWIGGALADRRPTPGLLIGAAALGALLVAAIPLVDDPVLRGIVRWDPGPRLNVLLAAVALFGPMSVVLATVTPIAVRIRTLTLAALGRTAGRLFAISTIGSIVGTFATAFLLVPELGTEQLLAVAAAVLLFALVPFALASRLLLAGGLMLVAGTGVAVAATELAPERGQRLTAAAAANYSPVYRLRGGVSSGADYAAEGYRVLYRKETAYHSLAVVEDDDTRYLRFDSSFQSAMPRGRPFGTRFSYTDYLQLGLAYAPRARDVLFIGLGGGSAPKRFRRDFSSLRLSVVELDPVVVDVARKYFAVRDDAQLRIAVDDGRRYLQRSERRYDAIVIDAYFADSVPFHLTTREFLELVRSRLNPGGVVVSNVIGAIRGPNSRLFRSFWRTYRSVFPTVVVHPVDASPELTANLIVIAAETPAPTEQFLLERWQRLRASSRGAPDLERAIANRFDGQVETRDVPLLTDDYAPTDALILLGS